MQKYTDFDDSRFRCEQHPSHSYKTIYFGENCSHKRRLLCVECIIKAKQNDSIVSFQEFFQDPIGVLDQNSQYFKFTQDNVSGNVLTIIDSIETQINQLHQNFIDQIRKLKQEFQSISNQNREQLIQGIKVKEFQQQLDKVWNMDAYQGTEEFKVLEKQLNDIIVNWKNISQEYIKETTNTQQKDQIIQDLTKKLINYRQGFTQQLQQMFDKLQIPIKQLDLLWRDDQGDIKQFVYNEISQGKKIKYDLLYQGTRDGLTNVNYWQKCDQQSHLLTIITLKNGNTFGGYSSCQLNKALGNYVADNTNTSFIFQQNKQEIYKLKLKDYAICCNQTWGPIFGGGHDFYGPRFGVSHDFYVNTDFKTVCSNLGVSYDVTGYNVQNKSTHLIGDKDIEIIECKVYKITFL